MSKVKIGISEENLKLGGLVLNKILADEFTLYVKLRNYHWNVVGIHFIQLHKFFEEQYDQIDGIIDEIAERARQLGSKAVGNLSEYVKISRLKDETEENLSSKKMLENILQDHETMATNLRNDIDLFNNEYKDVGTGDFVTGLLQTHEKLSWLVRAHLEN